jgi:hypothetical protein
MSFYAKDDPACPVAEGPETATLSRAQKPRPRNAIPPILTVGIGHRFYSPSLGRWMSRDPIGERGGINVYALLGNAPPVLLDRLGLAAASGVGDASAWVETGVERCSYTPRVTDPHAADDAHSWIEWPVKNPPLFGPKPPHSGGYNCRGSRSYLSPDPYQDHRDELTHCEPIRVCKSTHDPTLFRDCVARRAKQDAEKPPKKGTHRDCRDYVQDVVDDCMTESALKAGAKS